MNRAQFLQSVTDVISRQETLTVPELIAEMDQIINRALQSGEAREEELFLRQYVTHQKLRLLIHKNAQPNLVDECYNDAICLGHPDLAIELYSHLFYATYCADTGRLSLTTTVLEKQRDRLLADQLLKRRSTGRYFLQEIEARLASIRQ